MKIVFINQYPFSYLGGVEQHIHNLARALLRKGAKVSLICRKHATSEGWQPQASGIEVLYVSGIREMFSVMKSRRKNIDICHAHMARKPFALYGLICARLLGIPTIFTPHCFYPGTGLSNRLVKFVYDNLFTRLTLRLAERVINLTACDQTDAMAFGMPSVKSRIIPNSIHVSALRETPPICFKKKYGIPADYLLHVGRFSPAKCVEFLVRNHAALEGVSLVLVGQDDGELAKILNLARTLGLSSRVRAFQKIPFQELCAAYREARALVMASLYEGLPTVILEAGAFGTPTVAPRVGGIPYMNGVNVALYQWGDDHGYRECVRRLLAKERTTDEATQARVFEQYDWENNSAKTMDTYRELIMERQTIRRLAKGERFSQES